MEVSDNKEVVKALERQSEQLKQLETIVENQAEALQQSQERYEMLLSHTEAQEMKIAEMNQYMAYIFVVVLAVLLYRILSGALSSMFGGG
ncbi:MAG: hypothetical protein NC085_08135 [Muribaculaceae bacterium]|nr:hypothetical protein [Muribaculaceae bacterium]